MISESVKEWLRSTLIALIIASIALLGGVVAFKVISFTTNTMHEINQVIKKPSYEYLKSVTVRIMQEAEQGTFVGTGSIIRITKDYTYILTNRHVAPLDSLKVYVVDENMNNIDAEVISNCSFADLSIIRVEGKIDNKRAIKKIGYINYSEKAYSVGMYLGYYYIYTEGTMAGYDESNNFVMNVPGAGGCSGSGVFNNEGELVAVIFAGNYIHYPYQVETAKLLCINTWDINMFIYMNEVKFK